MREVEGKTIAMTDHAHKRRKDCIIDDPELIKQTQARIRRRDQSGDGEGALVQCDPHGALHRLLLRGRGCRALPCPPRQHHEGHRASPFRGVDQSQRRLRRRRAELPGIRPRGFKVPTGGAVVFSGALLHAVSRVTRGRRYAFLPFLYDDAAARMREANNKFLGEGAGALQVRLGLPGIDYRPGRFAIANIPPPAGDKNRPNRSLGIHHSRRHSHPRVTLTVAPHVR